jgi:bifunctional non-homologous end joining protein LigD
LAPAGAPVEYNVYMAMMLSSGRLQPMLATSTEPFDDHDYLFEIKWDGVRALAAVEDSGIRLWGREAPTNSGRYPELAVLRQLPAGTVLDGELVMVQASEPAGSQVMPLEVSPSYVL